MMYFQETEKGKFIPTDDYIAHVVVTKDNKNVFLVTDKLVFLFISIIYEPRHDKTCLREFPTMPDTNRPAQPQKLARVFKFRL